MSLFGPTQNSGQVPEQGNSTHRTQPTDAWNKEFRFIHKLPKAQEGKTEGERSLGKLEHSKAPIHTWNKERSGEFRKPHEGFWSGGKTYAQKRVERTLSFHLRLIPGLSVTCLSAGVSQHRVSLQRLEEVFGGCGFFSIFF